MLRVERGNQRTSSVITATDKVVPYGAAAHEIEELSILHHHYYGVDSIQHTAYTIQHTLYTTAQENFAQRLVPPGNLDNHYGQREQRSTIHESRRQKDFVIFPRDGMFSFLRISLSLCVSLCHWFLSLSLSCARSCTETCFPTKPRWKCCHPGALHSVKCTALTSPLSTLPP